jgi:hypothetical protein
VPLFVGYILDPRVGTVSSIALCNFTPSIIKKVTMETNQARNSDTGCCKPNTLYIFTSSERSLLQGQSLSRHFSFSQFCQNANQSITHLSTVNTLNVRPLMNSSGENQSSLKVIWRSAMLTPSWPALAPAAEKVQIWEQSVAVGGKPYKMELLA